MFNMFTSNVTIPMLSMSTMSVLYTCWSWVNNNPGDVRNKPKNDRCYGDRHEFNGFENYNQMENVWRRN